MALQQQGCECLPQGISLQGVDGLQIAMPGRMDGSALWNDWVLISLKGVELVRGCGPGRLSAGLVMGANHGECSPADLAHSHVPRAESRDLLLAWV